MGYFSQDVRYQFRAIASNFFNIESAERTEFVGVQTTFLLKSETKHKKEL